MDGTTDGLTDLEVRAPYREEWAAAPEVVQAALMADSPPGYVPWCQLGVDLAGSAVRFYCVVWRLSRVANLNGRMLPEFCGAVVGHSDADPPEGPRHVPLEGLTLLLDGAGLAGALVNIGLRVAPLGSEWPVLRFTAHLPGRVQS